MGVDVCFIVWVEGCCCCCQFYSCCVGDVSVVVALVVVALVGVYVSVVVEASGCCCCQFYSCVICYCWKYSIIAYGSSSSFIVGSIFAAPIVQVGSDVVLGVYDATHLILFWVVLVLVLSGSVTS